MKIIIEINQNNLLKYQTDIISLIKRQMSAIDQSIEVNNIDNFLLMLLKTDQSHLFLLLKDNHPVGFALINIGLGIESKGYYAWLNEIYIDDVYQNQRLGSFFISEIKLWLEKNNISRLLGISDKKAVTFYKHQGFEITENTLFNFHKKNDN